MIKALIKYLKDHKHEIVVERQLLEEVYDPTYGLQEPRAVPIEVVDFNALLRAIDEFSDSFKEDDLK